MASSLGAVSESPTITGSEDAATVLSSPLLSLPTSFPYSNSRTLRDPQLETRS